MQRWLVRALAVTGLTLASAAAGGAAHAVDYFGAIAVHDDGRKVSEASHGAVYIVRGDEFNSVRLRIRFRDVTADHRKTYVKALQDLWFCEPRRCYWSRMNNDETNKYDHTTGWRTSRLTEGRPWHLAYRSMPILCHQNEWYLPDDCTSPGWQYP